MPDVFGISIIQGRLQDINGVPVVGICETPFTGTNALAKRISDIILATIILILTGLFLLAFLRRVLSSALRRWLILISAVAHQRQAVALLTPSLR